MVQKGGMVLILAIAFAIGISVGYYSSSKIHMQEVSLGNYLLSQGWKSYYQEDYSVAIDLFNKGLEENGNAESALNGLGWSTYRLAYTENSESYSKAKDYFNQVLHIDSKNFDAINGLGWIANREGDYDDAISKFRTVLAIYPNNAMAKDGIAFAKYKTRNFDEAEKTAIALVAEDPDNEDAKVTLAYTYLVQRKLDLAFELFNELPDSNPSKYEGLGAIAYLNDDYGAAKEYFTKQTMLRPRDQEALHYLAWAQMKLNEFDTAKENFIKVLELNPEYPYPYLGLTYVNYVQGNSNEAQSHLNKYISVYENTKYEMVGETHCVDPSQEGYDLNFVIECIETHPY